MKCSVLILGLGCETQSGDDSEIAIALHLFSYALSFSTLMKVLMLLHMAGMHIASLGIDE